MQENVNVLVKMRDDLRLQEDGLKNDYDIAVAKGEGRDVLFAMELDLADLGGIICGLNIAIEQLNKGKVKSK